MPKGFSLDLRSFPNELNALLAFLQTDGGSPHGQPMQESLRDIDWDQFVELAMHHRVYPQVYAKWRDSERLPAEVRHTLKAAYEQNVFHMLGLCAELERICRTLADKRVRPLVLKGPVLAKDLYGDISLRTSKDLDILIPLADVGKAERIFAELGYRSGKNVPRIFQDWKWKVHHLSFVHPQTGIQVEIHWRLNADMGKEPSFEELWERKRTSPITGGPVWLPGKEDLFLYLVTHGARHGWFRLRWLADIDRLARQELNWPALIGLLRRNGCLHLGGQALVLASQLLRTPVPEAMKPFVSGSRPRRLAQRSLYFIRDRIAFSPEPSSPELARYYKRYLFSLKTGREKGAFLIRRLYPSFRDAEALPLPKELRFLYFPLRPFIWLWRQMKA